MVIAMDTMITETLELEGYARDVVRAIQDLRKEKGYEVSDRITIALRGEKIDQILGLFEEYIALETLSSFDTDLVDGDISRDIDIEGFTIQVVLKK